MSTAMRSQRAFSMIEALIVAAVVAVTVAAFALMTDDGPTVTLRTEDWRCVREEQRPYTYTAFVGKVPVQQTGIRTECVEWRRADL